MIKPAALIGILLSSRRLEHSEISVSSLHVQDVKRNLDHQINIDQMLSRPSAISIHVVDSGNLEKLHRSPAILSGEYIDKTFNKLALRQLVTN